MVCLVSVLKHLASIKKEITTVHYWWVFFYSNLLSKISHYTLNIRHNHIASSISVREITLENIHWSTGRFYSLAGKTHPIITVLFYCSSYIYLWNGNFWLKVLLVRNVDFWEWHSKINFTSKKEVTNLNISFNAQYTYSILHYTANRNILSFNLL